MEFLKTARVLSHFLMSAAFFFVTLVVCFFFFSSRRRHTRFKCDWSSDVCSSDLDSAVRAVAALDEPAESNPLAARVTADRHALMAQGIPAAEAARRAGYRVFGAKPGAYGAGLQALIDERAWCHEPHPAEAYPACRRPPHPPHPPPPPPPHPLPPRPRRPRP